MAWPQISRPAAALLSSALLVCAPLPAQQPAPGPAQSQSQGPTQVHATPQSLKAFAPDPKRAQKAIEKGEKAEAEGRSAEALAAYDEAVRYAPQDMAIVARSATLRSKLVRAHVDNAEQLGLAGNVSEAIAELRAALRVDATNSVVHERIAQMESMKGDEPLPPRPQPAEGLPEAKPQDGKHSFDLRGDTKTAYQQVAMAYGLKATFDPDLQARNVRVRVENVDFKTAMEVLGQQTGTFYRPLNHGLIFVAADTLERRRQYGLQVEQSFLLPSSVAPEEMTELLRVLREITGSARIELDSHNRSITLRDSLERVELAGQVIRQVEHARGEMMLEVELLEVNRDKARQLGITPPSSAQAFLISPNDVRALSQAADLSNALTIVGQLFSAKGFSSVPGFTLFGGGASTFLLTLPGVAANFSDALSLVQSGRQVLLRAQNGKPATFFVGDRYPVTLSLLSGSIGTGSGTGTVPSLTAIPTSTTFPETTFAVGNNPSAVVAATFSGGTLPDLAVANQNDNTISILLNQDGGNFVAQANSPFVLAANETGPVAMASGVFGNTVTNSNGVVVSPPGLVVANSTSNNVAVLLGNGDGTFTEAAGSPFPVGTNPSAVAVADFNGDGNLDFAVANKGDNTISVFKGDGQGGFTPFPASPFALTNTTTISESGPVALATANFRNTTIGNNSTVQETDLAVLNQTSNNVSILLPSVDNNGNVTFTEQTSSPIPVGTNPVAIAAGDLDSDGVPDLAVVNQGDNSISILMGSTNSDATFTQAVGSPLPTATTPAGIVIANFTGGNVPSLAVTNKGVNTLGIYIGLGQGAFSNRLEIATPTSPSAITTAILTTSGLPDVALTALGDTASQGVVTIIQDSSSFANGATPTQTPYPGAEYIDLGVKVKATPTLHPNRDVTLQLEFEIRALAGTSLNGIPVISNRTLSQTIRLKEDETSLVAGLLDDQEIRAITGLPGFANLPGLGYAFSNHSSTNNETEFLILVTPRRLRSPVRQDGTIFAGRGDPSGRASIGAGAVPQPAPPPAPAPEQPAQPEQPPPDPEN
ncbi:MAG TPA: FG-GAP-like repeat-containing protein [Candidatus Eisenbacteria bacterium]|jgi:type II secretory pathway component GspD/PulD (secretin)|nr:FG-GAP-like repeat-containing protein [Candidatus Eisenbacteria bacterium]